ncbi:hypothetical protein [Streptomyces sp. SAI-129]|uniref:hypothetical protein n=1 Tax=Streptomyces sp. SAI-129 TaxID=3377727 RepID=UPI003C79EF80
MTISHSPDTGITISRATLTAWAGFDLSPDQLARLARALPFSSVPDAVGTIADSIADSAVEVQRSVPVPAPPTVARPAASHSRR